MINSIDPEAHEFTMTKFTYCTQLKESGLSFAIMADLMSHADTRMVETVYARTRHEGVMKQMEAVEAINAVL